MRHASPAPLRRGSHKLVGEVGFEPTRRHQRRALSPRPLIRPRSAVTSDYAARSCFLMQYVAVCEWQFGHNKRTFSRRLSLCRPLMWSTCRVNFDPRHSSPTPHAAQIEGVPTSARARRRWRALVLAAKGGFSRRISAAAILFAEGLPRLEREPKSQILRATCA
jgi:hypothetical protein